MKTKTRPKPRTGEKDLPVDVICGKELTDPSDVQKVTYGGQTYYFCCQNCAAKFVTTRANGKGAGKRK